MSGSTSNGGAPAVVPATHAVQPAQRGPGPAADDDPFLTPITLHDDPDQVELEEARRALAAEEAAATGTAAPAPAPAAQPQAPAATPGPVPYARVQELTARLRAAEEAAAYHEGRANALTQPPAQPAPATPPAAPQPPADWAKAAALEEEWMAITGEYDAGGITAVEAEKRKIPLLGDMLKLHINAAVAVMRGEIASAMQAVQPAPGIVDTAVMEAHIARLNAEHPWATILSDQEINALSHMAVAEVAAQGKAYPKTPKGNMMLQTRVAQLATQFGPTWHPPAPQPTPAPAAPAPAAPRTPAVFDQGTRPNAADVQTALQRANGLPPNLPASRGNTAGGLTLAAVATMTDDEIEALPSSERQRLLELQQ